MNTRNTFLFGAALAAATVAVAVDHATNPVPERPKYEGGAQAAAGGLSPCAAAPCAAGAATPGPGSAGSPMKRPPPPPPAIAAGGAAPVSAKRAAPPPPKPLQPGHEAPDLVVKGAQ